MKILPITKTELSPLELKPFIYITTNEQNVPTSIQSFHSNKNQTKLRFNLENRTDFTDFIIRFHNPLLDSIHCIEPNNPAFNYTIGDHIQFSKWVTKDRLPAFPFKIKQGQISSIECTIDDKSNIKYAFSIYEYKHYIEIKQFDFFKTGIYLGFFILLLVYNIGLYFYFKTYDYLYYILYLVHVIFILLYLDGSIYQWILFDCPGIAEKIFPYLLISGTVSLVLFTTAFLQVSSSKFSHLRNSILIILTAPAIVLLSLGESDILPMLVPLPMITVLSLLIFAMRLLLNGVIPARVYLLSFLVFFYFILMHSLNYFGFIPDETDTLTGLMIGGIIQNCLLSLAISEKINRLRLGLMEEMEEKIKNRTEYLNQTLQKMNKELQTAIAVQETFLPDTKHWEKMIGLISIYEPLGGVGGDLFDVLEIDENRIRFWVADATGHGIRGALYTAAIRSDWEVVRSMKENPSKVMDTFRKLYNKKYYQLGLFLSCFCLDWNQKTNEISYVSFGHCEPIILSKTGNVTVLNSVGKIMGLEEKEDSIEITIVANDSDRLLLFTDGLYEVFDNDKNIYGYENIISYLMKNYELPTYELSMGLITDLKQFAADGILPDDLTLLAFSVSPVKIS